MEKTDDTSALTTLMLLVNTFLKHIKLTSQVFSLEAKIATESLFIILTLYFVLAMLIWTSWVTVIVFVYESLAYFKLNLIEKFILVNALTIFIFYITSRSIIRLKQNLKFKSTRRQLKGETAHDQKQPEHPQKGT